MLSIGNKKFRNLQEQVGFNTEQIDNILAVLDGLNIQDNVVVVDDISNPLTAEEMEVINREVAFIIYNDELYIKKSKDSTYAYFDIVFSISGTTTITFNSKEITVTLSNGSLGYSTVSKATYSTSQIDTLLSAKADVSYVDSQLALKASLSGADFTGAITSPSITETNSGYALSNPTVTNLTKTFIYAGVVKTGNKLTLVQAVNLNRTGSGTLDAKICEITIPASVGTKLYPTNVFGAPNVLTIKTLTAFSGFNVAVQVNVRLLKVDNTRVDVFARLDNLVANTDYYFRNEDTLLLSDNLA